MTRRKCAAGRSGWAGLIAAVALLAPELAHAQATPRDLAGALGKGDGELRRYYQAHGWRPLWLDGTVPRPAAGTLLRLVDAADADGLRRKAFKPSDLESALRKARRKPTPKALAKAEVAASRTLAAYVQATRRPRPVGMTYQNSLLAPAVPSAAVALEAASAAPSLNAYVANMEWMHPLYAELREALVSGLRDEESDRLIRLNLERARALPADPAPRYVLIDAAGARLWMYENGKPVDSMKVVVGKPDQPTPMVAGLLTNAVLNPYWNVPVDLVQTRIAANVLDKGVSYLAKGGYQVLSDFSDKPKVLNPARIDWRAVADGRRELRVRQLPGKGNFMGAVKFNFPNADGIYLHDTPDKALLSKDVRTASSGCVRLEDAARLGRWLFRKPLAAKGKAPEQVVPLAQPVPVYITYLTAAPENGAIAFRDDVYNRDAAQWAALANGRKR
ncbi:MAG: L,D-transpeptidase family protein [Novosphingobium sp.]